MFKTGDVVRLNSGGPKMTVQRLLGDKNHPSNAMIDHAIKMSKGLKDGDPICQWFAGEELKSDTFKEGMLELVSNLKPV